MGTPEPYVVRLKALARVVDGDMLDLNLDLGFSLVHPQQWFTKPGEVLVRTTKEEK